MQIYSIAKLNNEYFQQKLLVNENCFFSQVLFRYAVAFFKYREESILEQKDTMSIHRYLRELGDSMTDIERITQVLLANYKPLHSRISKC